YARLRRDRSLRAPDAIQLACAATAGVDLFITNDTRLHSTKVAGIQFIVPLDRVPFSRSSGASRKTKKCGGSSPPLNLRPGKPVAADLVDAEVSDVDGAAQAGVEEQVPAWVMVV